METINDLNNIDTIALNYNREGGFDWSALPNDIKAKILKINKDSAHYKLKYTREYNHVVRSIGAYLNPVRYLSTEEEEEEEEYFTDSVYLKPYLLIQELKRRRPGLLKMWFVRNGKVLLLRDPRRRKRIP